MLRRRPVLMLVLLALCCALSAGADDRRVDKSTLTIMSFNAEFLWDGVDPEDGDVTVTFPWKGAPNEAEEHMAVVAEVVIRANPDVINLVEVENLTALTHFNDTFLAGRGYRPFLVQGTDTFTGQDVALLTRIDPDGMRRDDREGRSGNVRKRVSKNYVARLTVGTLPLTLIGVHLLAQPLSESRRVDRQAQADAIAAIARDENAAGRQVIILGDKNDFDGETLDHVDNTPISTVLRDLRSLKTPSAADDLTNAASFVAKASRFTSFFDRNGDDRVTGNDELSSIDHILVAPALVPEIVSVDIPHDHNPAEVSDHFPVVVRFRTACVGPCGSATTAVRIDSILANAVGNETQNEEVTLINTGAQSVSLAGWTLRDLGNRRWTLTGTVAAGARRTIRRAGQEMSLTNTGDTISLVNDAGIVVHSVSYTDAEEGELITPVP